jgi:hypothetical protein
MGQGRPLARFGRRGLVRQRGRLKTHQRASLGDYAIFSLGQGQGSGSRAASPLMTTLRAAPDWLLAEACGDGGGIGGELTGANLGGEFGVTVAIEAGEDVGAGIAPLKSNGKFVCRNEHRLSMSECHFSRGTLSRY